MGVGAIICQILPMKKDVFELLGGGEVLPDPRWRMPPHVHATHHELILIAGGSMLLKTRHGELLATSGDMLFYEAGLIHEEISQAHDPANIIFVAFRSGQLLPSFPLHMRDSEGRLRQLLSWLIRRPASRAFDRGVSAAAPGDDWGTAMALCQPTGSVAGRYFGLYETPFRRGSFPH